jgi:hypothetical protein
MDVAIDHVVAWDMTDSVRRLGFEVSFNLARGRGLLLGVLVKLACEVGSWAGEVVAGEQLRVVGGLTLG